MRIFTLVLILITVFSAAYVKAEEDIASVLEKQTIELNEREEDLKKEMERLKTLKEEVNKDIVRYTELLKQIEKSLQVAEDLSSKRLKHIASAYEAMEPDAAAKRLSGLDNHTAVRILLKMNSKKAGLVIGMMEREKATVLTDEIAKLKK